MNIPHITLLDGLGIAALVWLILQIAENVRQHLRTTPLRGPPSPSLLWGVSHLVSQNRETGGIYEQWAETYGSVYRVASPMGNSCLVVTDLRAAVHIYSQDTWNYTHTTASKAGIKNIVSGCSKFLFYFC